jgi:predicted RNase H-like nuclease (RuvC/YqgF family)
MKQTSVMIAVAACAWLLFSTVQSSGQSAGTDELTRVVAGLEALTARVDRLEHAADAIYEAVEDEALEGEVEHDQPNASGPGGRFMWLDAVEMTEPHETYQQEVERLQDEVRALERTAERQQRKVTTLEGRQGGGARRDQQAISRLAAERRLLRRFNRELSARRTDLRRMERAGTTPRQILIGHEGDTIITLHTERDLSTVLNGISVGDPVGWTGRRIEMDSGSETWRIESVRLLRNP